MKHQRSIRNLLINPFKQITFGAYVAGLTLSFVVVCVLFFIDTFRKQYQHVMDIFNIVTPQMQWEVISDEIFYSNLLRLTLIIAVFLVVLFVFLFKLTHRYYGPLVAIHRHLDDLIAGNYSKTLVLRKKDELQDLAKKINQLTETLRKKHGTPPSPPPSDNLNI